MGLIHRYSWEKDDNVSLLLIWYSEFRFIDLWIDSMGLVHKYSYKKSDDSPISDLARFGA